jgi:lipopolysaccharide export system protein LptA
MKFYPLAMAALLLTTPVFAQDAGQGVPIEITADKTLEWHKADLQYVARGNAMVKKGDTTIKADTMTADYHDGKGTKKKSGSTDIYRMTGIGHVSIDDKGNIATGDKVVYDMNTGLATMTGEDLKMISSAQTVTATDRFEYLINDGKIKAIGNAKLARGEDILFGDTITGILGNDADGKRMLDQLESSGHVKIVTPTEVLTGNHGTYNAKTNKAIITGGVKITRDQNVLTGERAEIDMATNISRLFGSSIEDGQAGGRVRGVFYPGNDGAKTLTEKKY